MGLWSKIKSGFKSVTKKIGGVVKKATSIGSKVLSAVSGGAIGLIAKGVGGVITALGQKHEDKAQASVNAAVAETERQLPGVYSSVGSAVVANKMPLILIAAGAFFFLMSRK